jgi:hypothetical protein
MAIINRMKISAREANNRSSLTRPLVRTLVLLSVAALTLLACFLRAQEPAKLGAQATTSVRMEFAAIPPGEFMMGCSTGDQQCAADENPRSPHRTHPATRLRSHPPVRVPNEYTARGKSGACPRTPRRQLGTRSDLSIGKSRHYRLALPPLQRRDAHWP